MFVWIPSPVLQYVSTLLYITSASVSRSVSGGGLSVVYSWCRSSPQLKVMPHVPVLYISRVKRVGGCLPPSSSRSKSCPSRISWMPRVWRMVFHSSFMRAMSSQSRLAVSFSTSPIVCLANVAPGRDSATPPCWGGRMNMATGCPSVRRHAHLSSNPHWSRRVSRSTYCHAVRGPLYVNTGTTHVSSRAVACLLVY
eukprot:3938332-Rhodomonas_salina.3